MTVSCIDKLLNDQEINYLADLFLARYGLFRGSKRYRYFKNAVILLSHDIFDRDEAYCMLARCENITAEQLKSELAAAVSQMPIPISEVFNKVYNPPPVAYQKPHKNITMTENDVDGVLTFLGIAFLYVITSNYPKYEFFRYSKDD